MRGSIRAIPNLEKPFSRALPPLSDFAGTGPTGACNIVAISKKTVECFRTEGGPRRRAWAGGPRGVGCNDGFLKACESPGSVGLCPGNAERDRDPASRLGHREHDQFHIPGAIHHHSGDAQLSKSRAGAPI
jgi:hypothetical protein